MGIFGNLFGKQRTVVPQLSQAEAAIGNCVADFKDRTKLSYVFIFSIMQALAVRLYVQEYGVVAARFHFERLVKMLTDKGTIREDQYKNFRSPEIRPQDLPHTTELDAILWKLSNDLVAQGCPVHTVAAALVNISIRAAARSGDGFYAAGLLMVSLKELRAGEAFLPHISMDALMTDDDKLTPEESQQADQLGEILKPMLMAAIRNVADIADQRGYRETPITTAITTQFLMLGAIATQCKRDNFLQIAAIAFDQCRDASPRPVKQATPENASRPGQTPERTKGQSAKIEFTVDAFMAGTVYGAMSREDFCDVVLTALRAGNLSDDEANFAVYAREWVISNADQRLAFDEWMVSEVHARMTLLQRIWLQAARQDAAINRMSFNEWYARRG
jgi:hypothetical protein